MSVKMQTTCTKTKRPYVALLFPGNGFGPFLRSLIKDASTSQAIK
ncbi:hypothetical protein AMTRI_Chr07g77750 [Amborella trichopoda]